MVCTILEYNFGVGEMGLNVSDLRVSLKLSIVGG